MPGTQSTVLVIDDEFSVRLSLQMVLKGEYNVICAADHVEGISYIARYKVDIILLDIRLRDSDGLKLLFEIKQKHPNIEVIMITAFASLKTIRKAIRFGAYDYIIKPFDKNELLSTIRKALTQRSYRLNIQTELEKLKESTLYLEELMRNAKSTMAHSSENIMTAMLLNINSRDSYTLSHVRRVTSLSLLIADSMGLGEEEKKWLKCAALLHDIGKVHIDGDILNKGSDLTDCEYEIIKRHPEEGVEIIKSIPFLERTTPFIRHHHERYDGSGYPDGLSGETIPLEARILAAADAIDSMTYSPFRTKTYETERVLRELKSFSGSQFDPEVVEAIISRNILSLS